MAYWLFKSEPDEYSFSDLQAEPLGVTCWNGIRNYQARNFLRDEVQQGDKIFIYHSSCRRVGIAGVATVVSAAYPDPAQFDAESHYYDPKASQAKPRWFCVDVSADYAIEPLLPLADIKVIPELENMMLLQQPRVSIQTVTPQEWLKIHEMRA